MAYFNGPKITTGDLVFCLDAENTKCYPGSGTAATNLASSDNNGTLTNGPTFHSDGYWDFDGTNDYIDCGNFHTTAALTGHAGLTFEAWWNADSFSSGHGIVGYYPSAAAGTRRGLIVWNGAGAGGFKIRMSTNGYNSYGSAAAPTGQWTHSAITLASDGGNVIYQNGVSTGSPAAVTLNTPANPAPIYVGRTEAGEYWNGKIAVVRIYSKILTANEVLQNYNALRGRFGV